MEYMEPYPCTNTYTVCHRHSVSRIDYHVWMRNDHDQCDGLCPPLALPQPDAAALQNLAGAHLSRPALPRGDHHPDSRPPGLLGVVGLTSRPGRRA